ncbi:hypothetical protein SLEP1_g26421 [Rubroshorea leprosula]|uniref:Uncharacterized protein n=1 Tax=Rubroshorea leprosula TaxID=152421 RepID=A0AAV5JSF6_9ROSI|nr:hypothetical protein SLEP1_g26421 [Rubroshorea leprosula]
MDGIVGWCTDKKGQSRKSIGSVFICCLICRSEDVKQINHHRSINHS